MPTRAFPTRAFPTRTFKDEFALDPGLLYLNSGTHSICPRRVIEAVVRNVREYERNPTNSLFQAWPALWQLQQEVAAFFGAQAKDFFFRPNVTAVLNAFILGAPLRPQGAIAVTDLEYGAIANIARYRAEKDGRPFKTLKIETGPHADAIGLLDQLTPDVGMLVVSHVFTGTGLVAPLERIAQETRKRGILLVVDGAHAPGALALDFKKLEDVDFYAGNFQKWMMGPKGTAFGWVPERNQAMLEPVFAGWTTFETPELFAGHGQGSRFQSRMLASACIDFAPFFALREMLAFWKEQGESRIQSRIHELQTKVEALVDRELGWKKLSPSKERRGPLVAYELPESCEKLGYQYMYDLLHQRGLQISVPVIDGKFALRLSPHIYNTEDELERAVAILKEYRP